MHRVDSAGATGGNLWTDGNPGGGIPATTLAEDWHNDIQEEICNLIEAAGITLVKGTQNQMIAALATGLLTTLMKGGTGNATELSIVSGQAFAKLEHATTQVALHLISGGAADVALRYAQDDVSGLGVSLSMDGSNGNWRVASATDADADGSGTYVAQFWVEPGGLLGMRSGFDNSASGYCKITNGFMLQWGIHSTAVGTGASGTKVFPTAFPTACRAVMITPRNSALGGAVWLAVDAKTASGFDWYAQFHGTGGSIDGFEFLAIGY